MKVSVIIPVYNEEKYIRACLKHIFSQTEMPDEVIVVDNNCSDRTMEIVKKFPVRVVREKAQGMIPARNKGFNSARYAIIIRTDADTIVPKDWIKRIKEHFIQKRDLIALSGPATFYEVPEVLQVSRWPTEFFFKSFKQICGHECLFGPNLAIRKSAWEKVKDDVCFDDRDVHEDMDLALHIAYYGKIIFDSELIVSVSPRRWKKITSYFEQPYRYLNTIGNHHNSIRAVKRSKNLVKKVVPRTKRLFRSAYSALNNMSN